jgi:hypothetical protein
LSPPLTALSGGAACTRLNDVSVTAMTGVSKVGPLKTRQWQPKTTVITILVTGVAGAMWMGFKALFPGHN